ncbi:hypothetical protein C0431_14350 [bacterium]|jgi:hypothetical protein|nr:hypothetical protein [bacterium]
MHNLTLHENLERGNFPKVDIMLEQGSDFWREYWFCNPTPAPPQTWGGNFGISIILEQGLDFW